MTTTVYYGQTKSDRAANYIPACDGWKRVAGRMPEQDLVVFDVPDILLAGLTKETVAEALFIATNAPDERSIATHGRLAMWFAVSLRLNDFRVISGEGVRSVSVGDTVTVEGQPSVACEKQGWKEIA